MVERGRLKDLTAKAASGILEQGWFGREWEYTPVGVGVNTALYGPLYYVNRRGKEDNIRVVFKPPARVSARGRDKTEYRNELAVAVLNRYLGNLVELPTGRMRNVPGSPSLAYVMHWLPADGHLFDLDGPPWRKSDKKGLEGLHLSSPEATEDFSNLAVLDVLSANTDRNGGNALVRLKPNRARGQRFVIAIDHGFAFEDLSRQLGWIAPSTRDAVVANKGYLTPAQRAGLENLIERKDDAQRELADLGIRSSFVEPLFLRAETLLADNGWKVYQPKPTNHTVSFDRSSFLLTPPELPEVHNAPKVPPPLPEFRLPPLPVFKPPERQKRLSLGEEEKFLLGVWGPLTRLAKEADKLEVLRRALQAEPFKPIPAAPGAMEFKRKLEKEGEE